MREFGVYERIDFNKQAYQKSAVFVVFFIFFKFQVHFSIYMN